MEFVFMTSDKWSSPSVQWILLWLKFNGSIVVSVVNISIECIIIHSSNNVVIILEEFHSHSIHEAVWKSIPKGNPSDLNLRCAGHSVVLIIKILTFWLL